MNTFEEVLVYRQIQERIKGLEDGFSKFELKQESDEEFYKNLDTKLNDFNPKFMLYGCYNVGKSTLINALLAKEVAKVADKAETSQIVEYKYKNYTFYDTPGLNADKKHDETTEEHYKKCELIVFVMSDGGDVEFKENYRLIKKIVTSKKPVIIAFNRKQDSSEEELQLQLQKVYENLEKQGIDEQIRVIAINAKSALKAKLENKENLLKDSNIKALELAIDDILKSEGLKASMNLCNEMIRSFIEDKFDRVVSKIDNIDVKKLQELANSCENKRTEAKKLARIQIEEITENMYNSLVEAFKAEKKKEEFDDIVYDAEGKLNAVAEKVLKEFKDEFSQEVEKVKLELQNDIKEHSDTFNHLGNVFLSVAGASAGVPIPFPQVKIPGFIVAGILGTIGGLFKLFAPSKAETLKQQTDQAKVSRDNIANEAIKETERVIDSFIDSVLKNLETDKHKNKVELNALIEFKKEMGCILKALPTPEGRIIMNDDIKETIEGSDLPEKDKARLIHNILNAKATELNMLIVGGTGVGKSSTINALFAVDDKISEQAKVGVEIGKPETMDIQKYEIRNLILWDTPGLGDGEKDEGHKELIKNKLNETKEGSNEALIDLVLVIIDASSKDLSSAYELINKIIIPNMREKDRIVIAMNKCDMIGSVPGRYDYDNSKPTIKGIEENEKLVKTIKERIKSDTDIDVEPIYYSAGYKEEDEEQKKPYNLSKLLYHITKAAPPRKRFVLEDKISEEKENFVSSDDKMDYMEETKKSWWDSFIDFISDGIDKVTTFLEKNEKIKDIVLKSAPTVIELIKKFFKK